MTGFRFIHTSDLHLGCRFEALPDDRRGRLAEARHGAIRRVANAGWLHGARHILVAGDLFDTRAPTDHIRRQALSAMGAERGLDWWLLPGHRDSLAAATLWERIAREAPPNVTPILSDRPIELDDDVVLLPAPVTGRHVRSTRMTRLETDPRRIRIGLAHGTVHGFDEDGTATPIPPELHRTAGLDYLALGGWHGRMRVSSRCHYSGTPEQDGFRHDACGACLAVTIDGPGATPQVQTATTGTFLWTEEILPLLPGRDPGGALRALLPSTDRSEVLVRVRAEGLASRRERNRLVHIAAQTRTGVLAPRAGDRQHRGNPGARWPTASLVADMLMQVLAMRRFCQGAAALRALPHRHGRPPDDSDRCPGGTSGWR